MTLLHETYLCDTLLRFFFRQRLLISNHKIIIVKGQYIRTTAIFNKNMLESSVNPDISNILFLLYDIVNDQNHLVMFTSVGIPYSLFCVRRLTRHSNWIKVCVKPAARQASVRFQWKISTFCLTISCSFILDFA